jgi:hypothetical protein
MTRPPIALLAGGRALRRPAVLALVALLAGMPGHAAPGGKPSTGMAGLVPPMRLACARDALPSTWEAATMVIAFERTGRLTVTSGQTIFMYAFRQSGADFDLKPMGMLAPDGRISTAADTAHSRLFVVGARSASSEGDPRYEARLTLPTRSGERVIPLGCIMVRGV